MAQREIGTNPIGRTKSLRVVDERRREELARGVIRRYFLQRNASDDVGSRTEDNDEGIPIIPSSDGDLAELESNPSTVGEPSPSLTHTSTPRPAAKPKKLYLASTNQLSPIQSPSLEPSNSQEDADSLTDSQTTFTRDTPFRHSAVVLPLSSSNRSEDEVDRGLPETQSEIHRLRSSSCVYPSAGTRIPPDQRELVPMQIADLLRDIADNQVEPSLRQQGLLDRLTSRGTDVQLPNNGDILQTFNQQLEGLMRDGRPHNPEGGALESAVMYWAQGLILAKAMLQGLESAHPTQMDELQQMLEDALVKVFQRNQLMWWLNTPLSLLASFKNHVGAAVASCRDHLATWSPQLLGRGRVSRQSAPDVAMEQSEESGFFEHSSSVPSSPITTPTATRRRTSSISDLVTSPLMAAGATMVGAAATYYVLK